MQKEAIINSVAVATVSVRANNLLYHRFNELLFYSSFACGAAILVPRSIGCEFCLIGFHFVADGMISSVVGRNLPLGFD